jgi:hypothetical protein
LRELCGVIGIHLRSLQPGDLDDGPKASISSHSKVEETPVPEPPSPRHDKPIPRRQSQVPESTQQQGRISMSTAIPGKEASSQTMHELSFDDSDEDEDGEADDSREYLSAEEGYETENDDSPELFPPAPTEEPSRPAEPEPRPLLQRKRLSTTIGIVSTTELKARPSPLDAWTFDFSSRRSTRNVISPLGDQPTPPARSHLRQFSQESAQSPSTPIPQHPRPTPRV